MSDYVAIALADCRHWVASHPDWSLIETPVHPIVRDVLFSDFIDGMTFIARVSASAAAIPHRFTLTHNHRKIALRLTTDAIGGISEHDLRLVELADGYAQDADGKA